MYTYILRPLLTRVNEDIVYAKSFLSLWVDRYKTWAAYCPDILSIVPRNNWMLGFVR